MSRQLHFECLSGISGDMTLGALIDLGVSVDRLRDSLSSLGVSGLDLRIEEVKKCGFRATKVHIDHPEQKAHRHLHHINDMIDAADRLTEGARLLAKKMFHCVGEAEAKVHGCDLAKVHFHEVGAVDSIADIVGVAIALDDLKIDSYSSSPVPTGTGSIKIDHGVVPVPAPATAEILTGVPLAACEIQAELTTPTGAAFIKTLVSEFGPAPAMTPERVGYGAGTKDLPGQANVLRVVLGERTERSQPGTANLETDQVTLLECNLDDDSGERIAHVCELLRLAGALDVWQTPCFMKKGRLGTLVSVLAGASKVVRLQETLLTHSTTGGIRQHTLQRVKLPREAVQVETSDGPARGKSFVLPSGQVRFALEDSEAKRLSDVTGKTLQQVHHEAQVAFTQQQQP